MTQVEPVNLRIEADETTESSSLSLALGLKLCGMSQQLLATVLPE